MVGAGGVLTALYRDVAFRLASCPPEEAIRMLQELTLATVLKGFREFDLDCHSLANIISRTDELAEELGSYFHQIDINPIVFSDDQWIALDAQLTLAK